MQSFMQRIKAGVSAVIGEGVPTHGFADNNAGFHLVAAMLRLRGGTPVHGIVGATIGLGDFIDLDAPPCVTRLAEFLVEEIYKVLRIEIRVNRAHLPPAWSGGGFLLFRAERGQRFQQLTLDRLDLVRNAHQPRLTPWPIIRRGLCFPEPATPHFDQLLGLGETFVDLSHVVIELARQCS
jgi:hypothetical protein